MPGHVKELVRRIDSKATMSTKQPEPKPEPKPEPEQDSKPESRITNDDNPRTTSNPVDKADDKVDSEASISDINGEFASKQTPRVTSVMADGFAFIRDITIEFIEDTTHSDKTPIILLTIRLAEWAEDRLRAFSGIEKKQMVLDLLLWAVENQEDILYNVLGEDKDEIYRLIRDVIPSVIDVVCAASRGKLKLNHIKQATKTCMSLCF